MSTVFASIILSNGIQCECVDVCVCVYAESEWCVQGMCIRLVNLHIFRFLDTYQFVDVQQLVLSKILKVTLRHFTHCATDNVVYSYAVFIQLSWNIRLDCASVHCCMCVCVRMCPCGKGVFWDIKSIEFGCVPTNQHQSTSQATPTPELMMCSYTKGNKF